MSGLKERIATVIETITIHKNQFQRNMDNCISELDNIYEVYERMEELEQENNKLKNDMNIKDNEIDNLRSNDNNYNNNY